MYKKTWVNRYYIRHKILTYKIHILLTKDMVIQPPLETRVSFTINNFKWNSIVPLSVLETTFPRGCWCKTHVFCSRTSCQHIQLPALAISRVAIRPEVRFTSPISAMTS